MGKNQKERKSSINKKMEMNIACVEQDYFDDEIETPNSHITF
jgi:hypothetical protein